MRPALLIAATMIAGCGQAEIDNSMTAVVSRIRSVAYEKTEDDLYAKVGMKPDKKESERIDGDTSYKNVRFPAHDGFVWVTQRHRQGMGHSFIPSTIQFSQSGKRE